MRPIMDIKVSERKTQKSWLRQYDPAMKKKRARDVLAARLKLVFETDDRFRQSPDLAQRAELLGLVPKKDSFTRTINRILNAEIDPQLNTIETIAKAADVEIAWLLGGERFSSNPILREAQEIVSRGGQRAESVLVHLRGIISITADLDQQVGAK